MDQAKLEASIAKYNSMIGLDDYPRDENGFMHLRWSAEKTDSQLDSLTTDISSLEAKLKKFKEEKAEKEKYKKSDDYKESKKSMSKKKAKKKKESLLAMVFNDADSLKAEREADEEEDGGKMVDKPKKKGSKKSTDTKTTLDTTYGTRYSPMVEMYYDMINEFDAISKELEAELETMKGARHQTRYKSDQMGNLLSAKKSKADMIKEVVNIANKVSDLEYKKEKDKKDAEVGDVSREVSNLGAKYLRGSFDIFDMGDSKKKKKKDKDKEDKKGKKKDYDDEDDDIGSIKKLKDVDSVDDKELAVAFTKALEKNKDKINFTPAERYVNMDGKYDVVIVTDPLNIEKDWRFAAVNKKGKEIENFKKDYPGLLPRKNGTRMKFDLNRMKATDLNSGRSFKLVMKD